MFPERYSVIVMGPANAGVFEFCTYLAAFYLKNGQNVVMAETDTSKALVRKQLRNYGVKHDEVEDSALEVVDFFSKGSPLDKGENQCDPSDLPNVLEKIKSAATPMTEPVRIIFDSLSTLHIYSEPEKVLEFLLRLSDLGKRRGSLTVTLHQNMHPKEQVDALTDACDGLIEMRVDERMKRYIRMKKMASIEVEPKWMLFDIEPASRETGAGLIWKRERTLKD